MQRSQLILSSALCCSFIMLGACGGDSSEDNPPLESPTVLSSGDTSDTNNTTPLESQEDSMVPPNEEPAPIPPTPTECELDETMAEMLAAVNQARSERRYCGLTSFPPASALQWNCKLAQASQAHTEDMATRGFISHVGSDNSTMTDRINRVRYAYRSLSENVAAGYGSVRDVMSGWLNSAGHCRNIMNGGTKEMGAGFIFNANSSYQYFWTQNFGTPRN